ncbi:hypothetical protein COU37_02070 [Candidatus Micrarchaeota archaeon CG10_big_fil_rev_8_21_14_0_10_45_29]|nr:MAG: hypothetical protein COU37_02070 [Candidatus Micrarchaeota archaeon CG10_big_fil_rev_8_21_14_0_10_45_29]
MKAQILALACLLILLSPLYAQAAQDTTSAASQALSTNFLDDQYSSNIQFDLSNFAIGGDMAINATYKEISLYNTGGIIDNKQSITTIKIAKKALVSFYIDNETIPITDSTGKPICQNLLTDKNGRASCNIAYAKNPSGAGALAIQSWPHPRPILIAKLHSSLENQKIKPSMASIPLWTKDSYNPVIFRAFSSAINGQSIFLCIPIIVVFGLLLASMQYHGHNPLSLFDITVPRMPNIKKVRMKSPAVPVHLAMKGRLSARLMGRTEKGISSQITSLYKKNKKDSRNIKKEIDALFPRRKIVRKAGAFGKEEAYQAALARLKKLIDESGASEKDRNRAYANARRLMEVREVLALDDKVTGAARGGQYKHPGKINPVIDYAATRLAKPWKLIPSIAKQEWADNLPGLPYVERAGIVAQGWLAGRAGNLRMRRSLYKSLAAESALALGLASRESKFIKANIFEEKKLGEIPRIVEKMRQESYQLARALMDEHLRTLTLGIVLRQKNKDGAPELLMDKKSLEYVKKLEQQIRAEIERKVASGQILKEFAEYYFKEKMMIQLADYIKKNNISLQDVTGQALSKQELQDFLVSAKLYATKVRELLVEDGLSAGGGRYPDLTSEQAKRMDPNQVYRRYTELIGILDNISKDTLGKGRLPLVMLGHDLAEIFGKAVDMRRLRGEISADDATKMQLIRVYMETELVKKQLYDYIISNRSLASMDKPQLEPLLGSGLLNSKWLKALEDATKMQKVLEPLNYTLRGEAASRNFLTSFYAHDTPYAVELEKNKIRVLRELFTYQFDRGFEDLFKNYDLQVSKNLMTYHSMKSLISHYMDGAQWNAENYNAWLKKGATYGDIRKGVWIIDANHNILPFASGFKFDGQGRAAEAYAKFKNGHLTYDHTTFGLMGSDYAQRPINATLMFKNPQGNWKAGTSADAQTDKILTQLKQYHFALSSSTYGGKLLFSGYSSDGKTPAGIQEAGLSRKDIMKNIETLQKSLGERMRLVTRASLEDDPSHNSLLRSWYKATNFVERVTRGGINDLDMRLQEWYASQTYARMVLSTYESDMKKGIFYSDETQKSLTSKEELNEMRKQQIELMKNPHLGADERARLSRLTNVEIPAQITAVRTNEQMARKMQRELGWVDRHLKSLEVYGMFYNVAENTVMRDPRITFGNSWGLGPALQSGYHSGQFVGEHPQMWAGYHLLPGDRLMNFFARPSYWAASAFALHTRTFFTKMTGYATVYHQDPEYGFDKQGAPSSHEPSVVEAIQSLFKPTTSFDWLSRTFLRPMVRRPSDYTDEFGVRLREDSVVGMRYRMPLSFKFSDIQGKNADSFGIDDARFKQIGTGAADEMRRRKFGLTFREEFMMWNKRYDAQMQTSSHEMMDSLKSHLASATSAQERQMIRAQMQEVRDIYHTAERAAWKIPIVRDFARQGYYAVENRSGYDINTIGGVHRGYELSGPWHKTIAKAPIPGMIWTDWEGRAQPYGYVTNTIFNNLQDSGKIKDSGLAQMLRNISPERRELASASFSEEDANDYMLKSGLGRHLASDSLRDLYKNETPVILEFEKVERQKQQFQYSNSPYIFPIAPAYVLAYQMFKKSAYGRSQPWSSTQARPTDSAITPQQDAEHAQMMHARQMAIASASQTYSCPAHGITLQTGQQCPLCASSEERKLHAQDSRLKQSARKSYELAKNWALSAASLGGTIPIGNYNQYFNSARCPHHGIPFERGTVCPMCLENQVKTVEGFSHEAAREYQRKLKDYMREINRTARDRHLDEEQRNKEILRLMRERDEYDKFQQGQISRDKRLGYSESYVFLQNQIKTIAENDKKYRYTLKFEK